MPDPTTPPVDAEKPWYQRSSFSSAVLATSALCIAGIRHGWGSIPDEVYVGGVTGWLTFFAFTTLSPSWK